MTGIVGEVRENLHGGHDVIDTDGTGVLDGRPSLRGGELLRDPVTGRLEFEARPSWDSESIRDLNTNE